MGGKNHQPCHIFLSESTNLSRSLSLAYAELELGNVALEDVILAELRGSRGSIIEILHHLFASQKNLNDAKGWLAAIADKMESRNFIDLPTLKKVDLSAIGKALAARGIVTDESWSVIAAIMKKDGFRGVVSSFDDSIDGLKKKTSILSEQISDLNDPASRGEICKILEENLPGNIKVAFAALYNEWARFNQEFLASSLFSTELWYALQGSGSLLMREIAVAVG